MKLGIVSGVYCNYSLNEAVAHIAAAGYDCIDVWGGRPHVYRRDFSPQQLRQLRKQIEEAGLTVASFLPAFHRYPYSLSSPVGAIRRDSLQYMRECMDNAAELGAQILLIVPLQGIYQGSIEEGRERLIDSINAICEEAVPYPFKLGLEVVNPTASNLVNTATEAVQIISRLDDQSVGIVLDTGHINLVDESAEEAIRRAGDRLLQVHVNDNDGRQQQNLIPGDGTFDFVGFINALRAAGYEGCLSAELGRQYALDPDPAVSLTI